MYNMRGGVILSSIHMNHRLEVEFTYNRISSLVDNLKKMESHQYVETVHIQRKSKIFFIFTL